MVQKAIEMCELDQKREMAFEVKDSILELLQDQNGNHVVQKIVEFLGNDEDVIKFFN